MQIIHNKISIQALKQMSANMFGNLVKAVVDIKEELIVVDADMHADQEKFLLDYGSKQENLWGINLYPELFGKNEFIEFDSMINLRPWQNNRSRGVDDEHVREKIIGIVHKLIEK